MKDKFSYFDFICYFIPGTLLLWAIVSFLKGLGVVQIFSATNTLTDTISFVILAFIVGHLVQAGAKFRLEKKIKQKYWNGAFFSEIFLLKGNRLCNEIDREKFIDLAAKQLGYTESELKTLESDTDKARQMSHSIYRKAYSFINNNKIGDRAAIANTYYNLFRGLSEASFYSAIIFIVQFIIVIVEKFLLEKDWYYFRANGVLPLVLFLILGCAYIIFRDRARQRGELHVGEVSNSAYSFYIGGK